MIRLAATLLGTGLLLVSGPALDSIAPGRRVVLKTRALQELDLPGVHVQLSMVDMGSRRPGKGVDVRGGMVSPSGKHLWLIQPDDGGRAILFPTGEAQLSGDFVAVEAGLMILSGGTVPGEYVVPVDGVVSIAEPSRVPRRVWLAAGGALASAAGLYVATRPRIDPPSSIDVVPPSRIGLVFRTTFRYTAIGGTQDPEVVLIWNDGTGKTRGPEGRTCGARYAAPGTHEVSVGIREGKFPYHQKEGGPTTTVETRTLRGSWSGQHPDTGAPLTASAEQWEHRDWVQPDFRIQIVGLLAPGKACTYTGEIEPSSPGVPVGVWSTSPRGFGDCGALGVRFTEPFDALEVRWEGRTFRLTR